ncbi:DUF6943 family protein [Neotamlana laminarinivorans]|uniref:Uncharacterized protein n=1 Tax=Neotamlana laminarinivorans TaxID=2883124 RepID=A0A9X1I397_9FLAO|nr:hypothetical protein [Tamlana laminarinivorans]MCB4800255.1 hypothetical protein [Tamlana laminarinivorans]
MQTFIIKTHQPGKSYLQPHFFVLNKGLNAGKPLKKPCPNCFVIIAKSVHSCNHLFHLTLMLQIGQFFKAYLKGSVIPFITINDCAMVIKKAYCEDAQLLNKSAKMIENLTKKEEEYQFLLQKLAQLKRAYIQSIFKNLELM